MKIQFNSIWLILVVLLTFSVNLAYVSAQTGKRNIYAGVISNKSFTVGAKNPGTGLFCVTDNGSNIKNIGFKNMRTFSVAVFPDVAQGLIYCANGNGFFVSKNMGKKWRVTTGWQITEVLEVATAALNAKIVYIGTAYGLYKSTEYGENFEQLTKRFVAGLATDIEKPERIYLGEEDGLQISGNGGKSFKKVANFKYAVNAIAQDCQKTDRLYLGTEDNGIFISDNRGKSWMQTVGDAANATVYGITVDRKNPERIFAATFEYGVLRSNDRGKTWQALTNGLKNVAVYDIVIHPDEGNVLFAGTANKGILQSDDNGATWKPFALDGTHVIDLVIK